MQAFQTVIEVDDVFYGDAGVGILFIRDPEGSLVNPASKISASLFLVDTDTGALTEVAELEASLVDPHRKGVFSVPFDTSVLTEPESFPQQILLRCSIPSGDTEVVTAQKRFRLKDASCADDSERLDN